MSIYFSSATKALLMRLILSSSPVAEPIPPGEKHTGVRRIEVTAEQEGEVFEVNICPGVVTTFLFNAEVDAEKGRLGKAERFSVVDFGPSLLSLRLTEERVLGTSFWMEVTFKGELEPRSVRFILTVVASGNADRRVEVYRYPRITPERMNGLTRLVEAGSLDERGLLGDNISEDITKGARNALFMKQVISLRASGVVGLMLTLENRTSSPWSPRQLVLMDTEGDELDASFWLREPIAPGGRGRVFIEAEAREDRALGKYVLKLSEDGPRAVTFGNITFPRLNPKLR